MPTSTAFLDSMAVDRCRAMFEDVRHIEMTNAEYHSQNYQSISKTRLTIFKNDPQEFYQRWVTGEMKDKDTEAKQFGRIFHEMVLESVGAVTSEDWNDGTLAVFRHCAQPRREPDIVMPGEKIWVTDLPQPGIIRQSSEWGDLETRSWRLVPDVTTQQTGFCAFADMHKNGMLFLHVPDYVLNEKGEKRTKEYRIFKESNPGKTLYDFDDWYKLLSMRRRLRQHGDANRCLFQGGQPEYTLVGKCARTGLEVRTRLDLFKYIDEGALIVDLKTSRDAAPAAWNKQADSDGLNMQAAMIVGMASHVMDCNIDFRFATIDKDAPFRPETFEIEPEYLVLGAQDYENSIDHFKECVDSGIWLHKGFGQPQRLVTPLSKMVNWASA